MSPGRLIQISSGGETSPATVIVIVLIVAVLGYLVLEHGTGTDGNPNPTPPGDALPPTRSSHRSNPPRTSAPAANPPEEPSDDPIIIPDVIYTDYTPGSYSDDEASKLSKNRVPPTKSTMKSGSQRILVNGNERRRSVAFIEGETAATDKVGWEPSLAPRGSIYSRREELEGKKDNWKKNEGVRPQVESRLSLFVKQLEEGGHSDLVAHMKWVELLVGQDYLGAESLSGAQADRYQKAIADTWVPPWGKVPQSMSSLVLILIRSNIFNVSALIRGMMDVPDIRNSRAAYANDIIAEHFEKKHCVAPTDDLTGKRERGEMWEEWVTKKPNDEAAVLQLVLGWFVLSYRGYEREQWTEQRARRDLGETKKGSKSGRKHAGAVISQSVEHAVGALGAEILLWLAWVGRRYQENRLFTTTGADLLDCTVRASISRLQDNSNEFFKMDITLFVPRSDELVPMREAKLSAHWLRFTAAEQDTGDWNAYWVRDALIRAMFLAQTWIGQHYNVMDAQGQILNSTLHTDRIILRRLFIRPGFGGDHVLISKGTVAKQSPVTLYADQRKPVLMQLDAGVVAQIADQHCSVDLFHSAEALRHVVQLMRITTIRFVNLRQNNWYTPSEGGGAADHFDPRQVAMMIGLLTFALGERISKDFPLGLPANEHADWKGAENDLHRPATTYDNTEMGMHPDIETGRTRPTVLYFGGMIPYFPAPGRGYLHSIFPWLDVLPRAKVFYIPLLRSSSTPDRLIYPGANPVGMQLFQSNTAAWLADWGTEMLKSLEANPEKRIVIVMESSMEKDVERDLHQPLDTAIPNIFIRGLFRDENIANEKVVEQVTAFLRILNSSVSIAIIAHCQTNVIEPMNWPLNYSTDHVKKATELVLEYKRRAEQQALMMATREKEGTGSVEKGGKDEIQPVVLSASGAKDDRDDLGAIDAEEKRKREVEEEDAKALDRLHRNPYVQQKMAELQKAEDAEEAKKKREDEIKAIEREKKEKKREEEMLRAQEVNRKTSAKDRVTEEENREELGPEEANRKREKDAKAKERKNRVIEGLKDWGKTFSGGVSGDKPSGGDTAQTMPKPPHQHQDMSHGGYSDPFADGDGGLVVVNKSSGDYHAPTVEEDYEEEDSEDDDFFDSKQNQDGVDGPRSAPSGGNGRSKDVGEEGYDPYRY